MTSIAGYYAVQREIFDAIGEVRRSATTLVSDVRYEVLGTTKDVQVAVVQVKATVDALNTAVHDLKLKSDQLRDELPKGSIPDLRSKVNDNDKRLDKVEKEVVRLRAESDSRALREAQ